MVQPSPNWDSLIASADDLVGEWAAWMYWKKYITASFDAAEPRTYIFKVSEDDFSWHVLRPQKLYTKH
jgi:hypothetical protein